MRVVSGRLVLLALTISVLACGPEKLSEEQAVALIRSESRFPKLIAATCTFRRGGPLATELRRLEEEGYFVSPEGGGWDVTPKGSDIIESIRWNGIYNWYVLDAYTHKADLAEVDDFRVDSKSGTAILTFTVTHEPTEYFHHLRAIDSEQLDEKAARLRDWSAQAFFKLWDEGWKVQGIQEL